VTAKSRKHTRPVVVNPGPEPSVCHPAGCLPTHESPATAIPERIHSHLTHLSSSWGGDVCKRDGEGKKWGAMHIRYYRDGGKGSNMDGT